MIIGDIITELKSKGILDGDYYEYKPLSGGTASIVYALTYDNKPVYCIKINQPDNIDLETYFLEFYSDVNVLPKLFYVDASKRYFVYSFIEGELKSKAEQKSKMLKQLIQQLINNYRPVLNFEGWGWADNLSNSWQEFLIENINYTKENLGSTLTQEDYLLVTNLTSKLNRKNNKERQYLLHGDCGIHNFIFCNRDLCGVIDPIPVVGEPIHDLIYAFCSSPDDLTINTLQEAIKFLRIRNYENELIYKYVLIGLYNRISICLEHHPKDLPEYLKAWSYWKGVVYK